MRTAATVQAEERARHGARRNIEAVADSASHRRRVEGRGLELRGHVGDRGVGTAEHPVVMQEATNPMDMCGGGGAAPSDHDPTDRACPDQELSTADGAGHATESCRRSAREQRPSDGHPVQRLVLGDRDSISTAAMRM
jgi:hypothetical protein